MHEGGGKWGSASQLSLGNVPLGPILGKGFGGFIRSEGS